MKLSVAILAILATVVVVDGAPLCDPSKLSAKFYTDATCATLDDAKTAKEGQIKSKDYKMFKGCVSAGPGSMIFGCDSELVHKVYGSTDCSGDPA